MKYKNFDDFLKAVHDEWVSAPHDFEKWLSEMSTDEFIKLGDMFSLGPGYVDRQRKFKSKFKFGGKTMKKLLLFWILCAFLTGCQTMQSTIIKKRYEGQVLWVYENLEPGMTNKNGELYFDGEQLLINDVFLDLWSLDSPDVYEIMRKHNVKMLDAEFVVHEPGGV